MHKLSFTFFALLFSTIPSLSSTFAEIDEKCNVKNIDIKKSEAAISDAAIQDNFEKLANCIGELKAELARQRQPARYEPNTD